MSIPNLLSFLFTKRGVVVGIVTVAALLGAGFGFVLPALNGSPVTDAPGVNASPTESPTETDSSVNDGAIAGTTSDEEGATPPSVTTESGDGTTVRSAVTDGEGEEATNTATPTTEASGETDNWTTSDETDDWTTDERDETTETARNPQVGVDAEANASVSSRPTPAGVGR